MAIKTEISLIGDRAKEFMNKQGIEALDFPVMYGLVEATNNREVVIYSAALHKRGKRTERKVSVNREGIGKQQLTKDVVLVVKTDAPVEVFAKNRR